MKLGVCFGPLARVAIAISAVVVLGVSEGAAVYAAAASPIATTSATAPAIPAQQVSTDAETALRSSIDAGSLADLQRSNFVEYKDQVKRFYDSTGYGLVWVRGGKPTPQAIAISAELADAAAKGLNPDDYDGTRWSARIAQLQKAGPPPSDADLAKFDLAMTVCTMRYVSNLHVGRVNPRTLNFGYDVDGRKHDLSLFLRDQLVSARPDSIKMVMVQVEPPFDAYRRLETVLPTYEEFAREDTYSTLPVPRKTLNPGDTYAGVPRLASLLRLVHDLPADAKVVTDPPVYQRPLVDAVKRFQGRHGLDHDGRLGAQTVKQLNVPLSERANQIKLAMERWRWVGHDFSSPPVIVNIPEFMLRCWDENHHNVLQMRVIVGKAYHHKTPVFTNDMRYLIFRPYWEVPPDIARAEMIPKLRRNADYLDDNNFEVATRDGSEVSDEDVDDATMERIASGGLMIRQRPGPKNALGLVKFIFPNDYSVYLHSTDVPQLFAKSKRDFSHGCIRVQNPVDLAMWVLRDQPQWDKARIVAAMNDDSDNHRVNLTRPIPVLIVYGTAAVRPTGDVQFFDDVYGYDAELEQALARVSAQ